MTDPINQADTEVVLPIICPGCGNEINLAVGFSLLPPGTPLPDVPAVIEEPHESEEA